MTRSTQLHFYLFEEEKLKICGLLLVTKLLICREPFEKLKKKKPNRKSKYQKLDIGLPSSLSSQAQDKSLSYSSSIGSQFCGCYFIKQHVFSAVTLCVLRHLIFITYDLSPIKLTNIQQLITVKPTWFMPIDLKSSCLH